MTHAPLVWVLVLLFEVAPPSGGPTAALAAATAEYRTRGACELAAGSVRWAVRERRDLRITFTCTAKE